MNSYGVSTVSRSMLLSFVFHGLVFGALGVGISKNYEELQNLAPKGIMLEMGAFKASATNKGPGVAVAAAKVAPKPVTESPYYHKKDKPHVHEEKTLTSEVASTGNQSSSIGNAATTSGATGLVGDPNGIVASVSQRYLYELKLVIEQNKRYPTQARMLGQEGKVVVTFTLKQDGQITDIKVSEASTFTRLNEAAVKLIENLKQFKAIPAELGKDEWTINLPIQYSLN